MSNISKSLFWAGVMVGAALVANANALSEGASFAIIMGLAGAAVATLRPRCCGVAL